MDIDFEAPVVKLFLALSVIQNFKNRSVQSNDIRKFAANIYKGANFQDLDELMFTNAVKEGLLLGSNANREYSSISLSPILEEFGKTPGYLEFGEFKFGNTFIYWKSNEETVFLYDKKPMWWENYKERIEKIGS